MTLTESVVASSKNVVAAHQNDVSETQTLCQTVVEAMDVHCDCVQAQLVRSQHCSPRIDMMQESVNMIRDEMRFEETVPDLFVS